MAGEKKEAALLQMRLQYLLQSLHCRAIERHKRLIQHPQLGLGHLQSRQRHTSLLPLRQHAQRQMRSGAKTLGFQRLKSLFAAERLTRQYRCRLQVFQSREFVFQAQAVAQIQQVAHEGGSHLGNGLSVPTHLAAGWLRQTADHAQQTGFARTIVTLDVHGQAATYQIGWTNDAGRNAYAHNLLLYKGMEALKERGIRSLDMGGINTGRSAGIARFKITSGAQVVTLAGTFWV